MIQFNLIHSIGLFKLLFTLNILNPFANTLLFNNFILPFSGYILS